MLQDTC